MNTVRDLVEKTHAELALKNILVLDYPARAALGFRQLQHS